MEVVGYPGHFAPASLKRVLHRCVPLGAGRLSGAFRPGLIEASTRTPRDRGRRMRYPGHFAPASLKRGGRRVIYESAPAGYPGHFAPASLKRAPKSGARPRESRGYPGHFAPASLKRRATYGVVLMVQLAVIRGISPRPH